MTSRDYERIYLGRIANLQWNNPANIFLTKAEIDRVSQANIGKILRQLKQVSNSSELELVLLEHWSSQIVPRYINDDASVENSTAALRDTLPQHLARAQRGEFRLSLTLEYENEYPDKYPSRITQLTLVDLLLQIMQKENKERGKLLGRTHAPPVIEYKPLLMFFGFRQRFNAQKGYILVLDSDASDLAERVALFMQWDTCTVHYVDYDLDKIIDPAEPGFVLPMAPDYTLPPLSFRNDIINQNSAEYDARMDNLYSARCKAFKTLDQKFSYDQEKEETRYECIGLLYAHKGEKRLMMLYVSPDKKKAWITGYLPMRIFERL